MYKLSIVEKAKRYDEAVKKLRSLHDNYDTVSTLIDVKEELENIFPELAESEDERVKKAILGMVYDSDNELWSSYDVSKSDVLAWLEKHSQVKEFPISQHKNKTCKENDDSLTSEDERIGKAITEFFKNYSKNGTWKAIPNVTKWIAWLEKNANKEYWRGYREGKQEILDKYAELEQQGEQKDILEDATLDNNEDGLIADTIKAKCEQKSAEWSEEDEKNFKNISDLISDFYRPERASVLSTWFDGLKERVLSQPNKVWSEEDKKRVDQICEDLRCGLKNFEANKNVKGLHCRETIESNIDWMRNTLPKPKRLWKPTEEQIKALEFYLKDDIDKEGVFGKRIVELYNDLKKLKD